APPPTWTLPIRTARVGIFSMRACSSPLSSSLNVTEGARGRNRPGRESRVIASPAFAQSAPAGGVARSFADEIGFPRSSAELSPHQSPLLRVCARLHPESVQRKFSSQHHPLSLARYRESEVPSRPTRRPGRKYPPSPLSLPPARR